MHRDAFVVAIGTVDVVFEDIRRASPRLGAWIASALGPLRAERRVQAPAVTFRFVDRMPAGAERFSHLPIAPAADGLLAIDHNGRSALLRLDEPEATTAVHACMDPWFFQRWVLLPTVRAALWRDGTILVRAASVAIDGRRIAVIGWERTGKTRVLLELVSGGAAFLSDDWLALDPDGSVSTVAAQLALRDVHRGYVPGRRRGVPLRRVTVSVLRRISLATARLPLVSMAFGRVGEWAWKAGTIKLALEDVFPGAVMATPGPLDAVVVLVRPGTRAPERVDVAEMLAAQAEVELGHCADLAATFRYAFPGRLPADSFAGRDAERARLADALATAKVIAVPCDGSDRDVARVAGAARDLARSTMERTP